MVIEHGSYWLHHHKYIYKLLFVLPVQRLDERQEVEIIKVIKIILENPSSVPHKINTTNFHVSIKSEFWSRHSKMFALLQLRKKFGHFQLFPKVFILNVRIRGAITGTCEATVNSEISHGVECSEVQPGEDTSILCNLYPCNAMTASPKSPALKRCLSTDSVTNLDPLKAHNTLSMLATPPKSLAAVEVSQSVLKTCDAPNNCESDKQSSQDFPRSLQRKRKYSYGTECQPPLKQMAFGSEDLWAWYMKLTIAEKKSKSFSSLLTTSEVRHTVHYFSDQTQYSYRYTQDNVLKDRTNTLKALIKKYEMDINFKFRNDSFTKTVESVDDSHSHFQQYSQMKETTHLSLDKNKTFACNSSCTLENISIRCTNDNALTDSCTYKNVSVAYRSEEPSKDICRSVSSENTSIEHCGNISNIPCTNKETFEGKDITGHNITNESSHSNHSANALYVVASKYENIHEGKKVAEDGSVPSVACKSSDENDTNNCKKIAFPKDSCLNTEEKTDYITDGNNTSHLNSAEGGNNANIPVVVANFDTNNISIVETFSSRVRLINDYTISSEIAHYMEPENRVLNSDLNQELCINSIFNTLDNNSCSHLNNDQAVKVKNIEHFAENSFIMFGDALETGFKSDSTDTNISKETKCSYLVYNVSKTDRNTQRCERRLRQNTGTSPLTTMEYPRPLDYNHVLTRRQFENEIKIFEDKLLLNVEDLMSSNSVLKPELRTRSMKGRSVNLKKLLQDLSSYPTVVLHRLEDQYGKQLKK